jgi:hypothetical protein
MMVGFRLRQSLRLIGYEMSPEVPSSAEFALASMAFRDVNR